MMDDRTCACGHEHDEHDLFQLDCLVDDCRCVAYEPMEPDDDPERRAHAPTAGEETER